MLRHRRALAVAVAVAVAVEAVVVAEAVATAAAAVVVNVALAEEEFLVVAAVITVSCSGRRTAVIRRSSVHLIVKNFIDCIEWPIANDLHLLQIGCKMKLDSLTFDSQHGFRLFLARFAKR